MKKISFLLVVSAMSLFTISCSKSSDNEEDLNSLAFADENVNAGKTNLSKAGTDLISEVTSLKNSESITYAASFSYFEGLTSNSSKKSSLLSTLQATGAVAQNDTNYLAIFKSLAATSSKTLPSLQSEFNKMKHLYTWNKTKKDWDSTRVTDRVEFQFPSTKTGASNDAKLVIKFSSTTTQTPLTNYEYSDVPASFDIILTNANNDIKAEYKLSGTYNNQGVPTSVTSSLTAGAYTFKVDYAYSTSNSTINYSFLKNTTSIITFYAAANGNFDITNITNNQSEENVANIITGANAYFQVYNIKLAGKIDFKSLYDEYFNIENSLDADSTITRKEADAFNKYAALVLIYADSNKKIAQAKAYSEITYDWIRNYQSQTKFQFVFTDKTSSNAETYFGSGFTQLQKSAADFYKTLNVL